MEKFTKAYELFYTLYNSNNTFKLLVDQAFEQGLIRHFDDNEFSKIKSQNFYMPGVDLSDFSAMFEEGYNIGNCVGTSMQLSYSYNDVDIVSGILPILKGTKNAEKEGGHCWLETSRFIIDSSLMLIIDKRLKQKFGYIEEQRMTQEMLRNSSRYQARKEFTNDINIKK